MKKFLFLLFVPFLTFTQISENTKVFLATIEPGKELYSQFGHSVLVFIDDSTQMDRGYNYGTFDFNTPNFYWKFLKGSLPYSISVYPFKRESDFYLNFEGRGIYLQELNLNLSQKITLFNQLETNLLPENRYYSYQFFFDNCSTRLKDLILSLDGVHSDLTKNSDLIGKSYRNWMNDYLPPNNWVTLGMNLALGYYSNQMTDPLGSTYIPNNLKLLLKNSVNHSQPIVKNESYLDSSIKSIPKNSFDWFGPIFLLPLLLFLLIGLRWKNKKLFQILTYSLYPILLVLFFIIAFLSFFTDHHEMALNPAVLIFLPLITAPYVNFKPIIYKINQVFIFISIITSIYEMTLFVPIIFVGAVVWVISSNFFINKSISN